MIPSINEAQTILGKYNKEAFHLYHAYMVSETTRRFARTYDPGHEDYWAVVGLLHDVDFELYPDEHCVKGEALLRREGVGADIIRAAMSHGFGICDTPYEPIHIMEKILFAADELTGLIGAAALMRPSKSVLDMEPSSVKKKFKDRRFAAGCDRDIITRGADNLGWTIDELIERTLSIMKDINTFYIRKAQTSAELEMTAHLADEIWHECYADILSAEQIDYMVDNMQSYAAITRHTEQGYYYYTAYAQNIAAGYCAAYLEEDGGVFLSKLYVLAAYRAQGIARMLLNRVIEENGALAPFIELTVNKNKADAIAAYERMGFKKTGERVTDIGRGLVMDDFVMKKTL